VKIAFEKYNGLVPAIVQDHATGEVLMLGFMNEEASLRRNVRDRPFSSAVLGTGYGGRVSPADTC
jgi:phosphoribosyl-AMP cyclohydrolase